DDRGRSALHLAAQEGHIEVARAILHAPATPRKYKWRFINAPDEQSYTALRYAVVNNQVDMVRYLLSVDVSLDWDTLSPWGTSALHVAVMEANLETIEILLHSPKVNVNKRDNWGRTALHEAVRGQISQIVSLLLGKPEIEVNPHAGMAGVGTPLQTAYEVGDMETVLTLIK
ncbi:ankyrin repeat-containing domain protein, partial [Triangularia setosa]